MECNTCGAHYMQNCSWWCGMSEDQIKVTREEYLISHSAKVEIESAIHSLKVGASKHVVISKLQGLLNKAR